jgi:RNA polymerase sigma-70 factor (ECF subfamily)
MKIWQNRSRLADVDNLNAYLYGIARHQIIDAVRQFARNIAAIDSLLDEQKEHTVSTPIEDVLSKEMNDALDEAIAQLSPQQRRAFEMRKLQGKSQMEIGEALHVSTATATGYTKDAVKSVRSYLLSHYPELFFIILSCYIDNL